MTDFEQQDDDFDAFLDDFDDETPVDHSAEDMEMRQDAFEQEVNKRIRMLMKPKQFSAGQRREAARWLGGSGEPDAIEPLVTVYQRDRTPGMKKAAAEALGQFKALENALNNPDTQQEALQRRLEHIVRTQEVGQRVNKKGLRRAQIGLVVTLVIFGAFAAVLGLAGDSISLAPQSTPTRISAADLPTNTPDLLPLQEEQALAFFRGMADDAEALRQQMSRITGENTRQNCDLEFATAGEFELSPRGQEDEQLVNLVEELNAIQSELQPLIDDYRSTCDAGDGILREDAIDVYGPAIVEIQRQLRELEANLESGDFNLPPTSTPAPTEQVPPTATATIPPEDFRRASQSIQRTISDMTGLRGTATTIQAYWQDVQNSGSSGGCIQPPPEVPADYSLPPEVAEGVPALRNAAEDLNSGLQLVRDSVSAFYDACESNSLSEQVSSQKDRADLALTFFQNAQDHLNEVN